MNLKGWSDATLDLRSSPRLTEALLKNIDAVLILEVGALKRPASRLLYANEAFARLTGYSDDEVVKKCLRFFLGPETDHLDLDRMLATARRGEAEWSELRIRRKDGTSLKVEMCLVPAGREDEENEMARCVAVFREAGRREVSPLLSNPGISALLEPDGTVSYVSPSVERVLGYRPEERIGSRGSEYVHPAYREADGATFTEAFPSRHRDARAVSTASQGRTVALRRGDPHQPPERSDRGGHRGQLP